jgi:hypothetical protein
MKLTKIAWLALLSAVGILGALCLFPVPHYFLRRGQRI